MFVFEAYLTVKPQIRREQMRVILFSLFFISHAVFAHGNIDNKHGACTLKISEDRAIHVSVYQPSTHEGDVFCQEAPDVVETIMVLDFMEEDSKKSPFAFSIGFDNDGVIEPIGGLPLTLYPQGSMLLKFLPKSIGKYHAKVMYLDEIGHDISREFDFYIGQRSPNSREPSSTQSVIKWLVILMVILGGLYILYLKRVNKDNDVD